MWSAGISLNDPLNLISLPRTFHARMHTKSYRTLVYEVFYRYTGDWDKNTNNVEKRADVLTCLSYLRNRIIIAYSANDPHGW